MEEAIVRRLVDLNKDFYEGFAVPFSESRSGPQPGYKKLLEFFPPGKPSILDVGCGNGRFGRYLIEQGLTFDYTGVDFSSSFISLIDDVPGSFFARDLSQPDSLSGLGEYQIVICLSTLQHIPGQENRLRLLREMRDHLESGCYLMLANWQFFTSPRQRRKILPWSTIGLTDSDVEDGDFLLTWRRGGNGVRYAAYLDAGTIEEMAASINLRIVNQYYSDGREEALNLYSVLAG